MQQRNFSLYGAVDLGARQAAAQRQQASAAAGQDAPHGEYVFDVTEATFEADVLERLAAEAAGDWVLAKVDVDANPQLSAALQVQSIPMVVGVIGGQLVPGFLGALPEAQVRQWLSQVLQVAQQMGMPGAGGQPAEGPGNAEAAGPGEPPGQDGFREPELTEAQQAMERGDLAAAAGAFERLLAREPGHPVATVGLAQVNLFLRVNSYDQAQARRDAAAHPDDVDAQIRGADIEMSVGNAEEAFDRLLGAIRRSSGEDRDKVRLHLVSLFEMFPTRDARVSKARSTLSSLLF